MTLYQKTAYVIVRGTGIKEISKAVLVSSYTCHCHADNPKVFGFIINLIFNVDRSVCNTYWSSASAIYHNFMIELWRDSDTSYVIIIITKYTK